MEQVLGSLPLLCQVLKDLGILSALSMKVTILLWVCVKVCSVLDIYHVAFY